MVDLVDSLVKPTFLISADKVRANIKKMIKKAKSCDASFRPHFKTHQSILIGELYRELGIDKITVSSVDMASYFAKDGWDDITIAFPVNIRQLKEIKNLAKQIRLNLLVESSETIRFLKNNLLTPVNLWIKVDVGYHRTGIPANNYNEILSLIEQIQTTPLHKFAGLLTHAGHSYTSNFETKRSILNQSKQVMKGLREFLLDHNIDNISLSYGDTPTCSIFDDFELFDELRPGNFVFYDLMQLEYNSCTWDEIAVQIACPVVAKHSDRNTVIIHGGGVHFSKEYLEVDGEKIFGYLGGINTKRWVEIDYDTYLYSLSQDHGQVFIKDPSLFDRIKIGDILYFYPVHSCMSANLLHDNSILVE